MIFQIKPEKKYTTLTFIKLMIFMQQMQYNAPNRCTFFKNFPKVTPTNPLFLLKPKIGSPPLQNPGCAPVLNCKKVTVDAAFLNYF